jgi:hypothetical protein
MAFVVGIAGVPGAGKSTLVAALAAALPRAVALHMDAYDNMTRLPIAELRRWIDAGADIDAFDFPPLQADLQRLKSGNAQDTVLLETQFGRAHRATGRHIDLLIWLDTPLDLALARTLGAVLARGAPPEWLRGYLEHYVDPVRGLLEMQRTRVAADADLVLDGRLAPGALAHAARARMGARQA